MANYPVARSGPSPDRACPPQERLGFVLQVQLGQTVRRGPGPLPRWRETRACTQ